MKSSGAMQLTPTWASMCCAVEEPGGCAPMPALFQRMSSFCSCAAKVAAEALMVVRSLRSRWRGLRMAGVEGKGRVDWMDWMAWESRAGERPAR